MEHDTDPGRSALDGLLRVEAHRAGINVEPDPARVADGWQLRFVADCTRVEAAVALYEELGFETCADPVPPQAIAPACGECRLVALLKFRAIYTRRRGTSV